MRRFGLVLVWALVAGCSDPAGPEADASKEARWAQLGRECLPDAPAFSLSATARDSLPAEGFENLNTRWAAIARRTPGGWGGLYLDGPITTIYLVDPGRAVEAAAALRAEGISVPNGFAVKQGRWDFAQMYDWYRYLARPLGLVGGVHQADIQEGRNRLEYTALDEETRVRAEEALAALGVPCFLVAIDVGPMAVATF